MATQSLCQITQQYNSDSRIGKAWKPFDPISCEMTHDLFSEFTLCNICPEVERCEIIKRLGAGTFGSTWLLSCQDQPEKRTDYVLKLVANLHGDPEFASNTEKEFETQILMAKIAPVIFQVCKNYNATKYIIKMEKMDETLGEHFQRNQPLLQRQEILRYYTFFFEEMRNQRMTHCDLSPNNIMLKYEPPKILLIDWGRTYNQYSPLFALISAKYYEVEGDKLYQTLSINDLAQDLYQNNLLSIHEFEFFKIMFVSSDNYRKSYQELIAFQSQIDINMLQNYLENHLTSQTDFSDDVGRLFSKFLQFFKTDEEKNSFVSFIVSQDRDEAKDLLNTTIINIKNLFIQEIWDHVKMITPSVENDPRRFEKTKRLAQEFVNKNILLSPESFIEANDSLFFHSLYIKEKNLALIPKFDQLFYLALLDLTNDFRHSIGYGSSRFTKNCPDKPLPFQLFQIPFTIPTHQNLKNVN
jgi:serine/threonine protein kinase